MGYALFLVVEPQSSLTADLEESYRLLIVFNYGMDDIQSLLKYMGFNIGGAILATIVEFLSFTYSASIFYHLPKTLIFILFLSRNDTCVLCFSGDSVGAAQGPAKERHPTTGGTPHPLAC